MKKNTFRRELTSVINRYSKENGSNTPDFLLADYLIECLKTFDKLTKQREQWYNPFKYPSKIKEIEEERAEKIANEINWHNECARATVGDLPKTTKEDILNLQRGTFKKNLT